MFPSVYKRSTSKLNVDRSMVNQVSTFATAALTTTYQTIVNLTSKGYLDTFVMQGNANVVTIRITVDGIVKFEGTSNVATNMVGVVMKSLVITTTTLNPAVESPNTPQQLLPIAGLNALVGFPYTTNTNQNGTLCILADSLYFKNTLLIEAKVGSATASPAYYVTGGSM